MHQALLYADEDQFLESAVPFIRDGLHEQGAVLAVVADRNIMALRGTMGSDAGEVTFVAAEGFYRHPVRTINEYSKIVHESMPRRVWALAQPVWQGLTVEQTGEWKRYESIVNAAFETSGAHVICAYDTRVTSHDVLDSAGITHPIVLEGQGPHSSRRYTQPAAFTVTDDRAPLPPPPAAPDVFTLGDEVAALCELRTFLAERAFHLGLATARAARPLLTAVNEAATNAIAHGAPPMEVRIWGEGDRVLCEVFDYGHWHPDALVGHLPREAGEGIGLWGVRLLSDTVQVRTGWTGTVIRMAFPRP